MYYVYILASRRHGTLYVGVTNSLQKRLAEHRNGEGSLFVKTYGVHRLVWFEIHEDAHAAIHREKCIKKWRRAWNTPTLVEICIGLEINGYLPAEF